MNKKEINLILVADKNVEIGLHVTLFSLLKNSSYNFHHIYLITKEFTIDFEQRLFRSLSVYKNKYKLHIIEFDDSIFDNYKGLHGNTFTYSKLVLSNLVQVDIALYLDIDVVVRMDIFSIDKYINKEFKSNYAIAANKERTFQKSLEYELYNKLGKKNSQPYFNMGILLVNLEKWREWNLPKLFLDFAGTYSNDLKAADQTVINGVLESEKIFDLPNKFNLRLENTKSNLLYKNEMAILHFFGRPKPWDLFADYMHPHHNIFKDILQNTIFKKYNSVIDSNRSSRRKFLKTYRSYIKVILKLK